MSSASFDSVKLALPEALSTLRELNQLLIQERQAFETNNLSSLEHLSGGKAQLLSKLQVNELNNPNLLIELPELLQGHDSLIGNSGPWSTQSQDTLDLWHQFLDEMGTFKSLTAINESILMGSIIQTNRFLNLLYDFVDDSTYGNRAQGLDSSDRTRSITKA